MKRYLRTEEDHLEKETIGGSLGGRARLVRARLAGARLAGARLVRGRELCHPGLSSGVGNLRQVINT